MTCFLSPGKGIPQSKEVIAQRVKKLKGQKRSQEFCNRLSNLLKGRKGIENNCGKPIIQYTLENNFIKEWPSMKAATKNLEISINTIYKSIQGKPTPKSKFIWKYKN